MVEINSISLRLLIKTAVRLLSITLLLGICSYAYSQTDTVEFIDGSTQTLCPLNNGNVSSLQTSSLEVSGSADKIWFASYSINGGPAENMNGGLGIDSGTFSFEVSFRNDTKKLKKFNIRIEKAWLEDGTQLNINEQKRTCELRVYPLAKPNIEAYESKVKTNSEIDYSVIIGMNSEYTKELPSGAKQISYETEVIGLDKYIKFKVKWQNEAGITTFKSVEKTGYGCNSDTLYSDIELKNEFSLDLGEDKNICSGDTVTLTPLIDIKSEYAYLWNTGETSESIEVSKSGEYELTVTDQRDNQKITEKVVVTVHNAPTINIDDFIVINGNPINVDVFEKGATYLWSTNETSSAIEITKPGDYSVTLTSEYGCANSKSFKVRDQSSLFTLSLPTVIHMCGRETMTLSPDININQTYTYAWSTGADKKEITIKNAGTYSLTVTDSDGYSQTASSQVYYHPKPIVDLGDDFMLWDGETKQLDAQNTGATYEWNTLETNQTITANSGGDFWVKVTDTYGCSNSDTVFVDYKAGKKFQVELGDDKNICQGDSILIVPEILGHPVSPLTYNWIGQSCNETEIYLKEKGNFTLEITDNLGNTESAEINISILPAPIVNLGEDIIASDIEQELIADIDDVSYTWSTGEISKSIKVKETGIYWVEVINNEQCSARDSIEIKLLDDYPFIGLPDAFSPNGDTHNDLLYIRGVDIDVNVDKIKFQIYNKMGQKVFETTDIKQGWDGKYKGHYQAMGNYYYNLDITYTNGVTRKKTGAFTLLR